MSKLPEIARNPFAFLAARWSPDAVTVRRATLSSLVMSVVLVVTGGAVRLTGSGLGCPTWPTCQGDSLLGTNAMGIHHAIELGNRMLTYVLCAAVGWAIVAVRARRPLRRGVYRLAWAQFWVVVADALWGGVTVLTHLNPYVVAVHFLLTAVLIAVAVVTWHRVGEGDGAPRPLVGKPVRQLGMALTAAAGALLVAGTLVTGAGPHPGDSRDVHRIDVDWRTIAQLHADLAWTVIALTGALWFVLRAVDAPAGPRARTRDLFLLLMSQGVIGYVQYFTKLPTGLVEAHMLGAALIWVTVLRLALSFRDRPAAADDHAGLPAHTGNAQAHGVLAGHTTSTQAHEDAAGHTGSAQGREVTRPERPQPGQPQQAGGPDTTVTAPLGR